MAEIKKYSLYEEVKPFANNQLDLRFSREFVDIEDDQPVIADYAVALATKLPFDGFDAEIQGVVNPVDLYQRLRKLGLDYADMSNVSIDELIAQKQINPEELVVDFLYKVHAPTHTQLGRAQFYVAELGNGDDKAYYSTAHDDGDLRSEAHKTNQEISRLIVPGEIQTVGAEFPFNRAGQRRKFSMPYDIAALSRLDMRIVNMPRTFSSTLHY